MCATQPSSARFVLDRCSETASEGLLPRSRRAEVGQGPDEGPGETEGVSPGAILRACGETKRPRTNPGPEWNELGSFLSCPLLLCRGLYRCWLWFAGTVELRFDGLGLLGCKDLLGFVEQVWLALVRNTDMVR